MTEYKGAYEKCKPYNVKGEHTAEVQRKQRKKTLCRKGEFNENMPIAVAYKRQELVHIFSYSLIPSSFIYYLIYH